MIDPRSDYVSVAGKDKDFNGIFVIFYLSKYLDRYLARQKSLRDKIISEVRITFCEKRSHPKQKPGNCRRFPALSFLALAFHQNGEISKKRKKGRLPGLQSQRQTSAA